MGAYCYREDGFYKCSTAITSAEAWDVTHWTEVIVLEEIKSKQDKLIASIVSDGTMVSTLGFDSNGNLVKGAVTGVVTSIGGKTGVITLGAGLAIDSNNEMTAQAEIEIVNLL